MSKKRQKRITFLKEYLKFSQNEYCHLKILSEKMSFHSGKEIIFGQTSFIISVSNIEVQSACLFFCYHKKTPISLHLQKTKWHLSSFSGLGMDLNISIVHIGTWSMVQQKKIFCSYNTTEKKKGGGRTDGRTDCCLEIFQWQFTCA